MSVVWRRRGTCWHCGYRQSLVAKSLGEGARLSNDEYIYYDVKTPRYGRYIGTYMNDGMHDKQVEAKATPQVMKGHAMKEMWTYKYESS
jgi:hypothetical protein